MVEAEQAKVLGFGGLLELAMAACWDEQEEEKEKNRKKKKKTSKTSKTPSFWMQRAGAAQRGWLEKAVQMGGTRPELVLRKRMFATDLSAHHTRLLLPCAHRGDPSRGGVELLLRRLTAAELGAVAGGAGLPVALLDRWGREYGGAALRRWRSNRWFVLNGGGAWMGVVERNALREGDVVEVFCFRASGRGGEGRVVLVLSAQVSVEEEMRRHMERRPLPLPGSPAKARKRKLVNYSPRLTTGSPDCGDHNPSD